jgi:hypothetical protein
MSGVLSRKETTCNALTTKTSDKTVLQVSCWALWKAVRMTSYQAEHCCPWRDLTLCSSLLGVYRCFWETYCLHVQGWRISQTKITSTKQSPLLDAYLGPWRWRQWFLLNVVELLPPDCTSPHPRRHELCRVEFTPGLCGRGVRPVPFRKGRCRQGFTVWCFTYQLSRRDRADISAEWG